jgi:osmotically-inducible protein OsmY
MAARTKKRGSAGGGPAGLNNDAESTIGNAGAPSRPGRGSTLNIPDRNEVGDYEQREVALQDHASVAAEESEEDQAGASPKRAAKSLIQRIRQHWAMTKGIDARHIQVDVERQAVILTGQVETDAMRQPAVDSVSATGGVRLIRDRIRLKRVYP